MALTNSPLVAITVAEMCREYKCEKGAKFKSTCWVTVTLETDPKVQVATEPV